MQTGYMKRQQAFVTFVAAISVLAGAGLLLLVQHVTDRLGVTRVPRCVLALLQGHRQTGCLAVPGMAAIPSL